MTSPGGSIGVYFHCAKTRSPALAGLTLLETLTVRVYSRRPPQQMTTLQVDGDSHTSVVLAQVLWNELYGTGIQVEPLSPGAPSDAEAILLIGDKVVTQRPPGFDFEIDLGGAWRSLTDLPFVFAVWCKPRDLDPGDLPEVAAAVIELSCGIIPDVRLTIARIQG